MSVTNDVTVSDHNGSLLSSSLLSGYSQTLILNSSGSSTGTTVTENNSNLQVGESLAPASETTANFQGAEL